MVRIRPCKGRCLAAVEYPAVGCWTWKIFGSRYATIGHPSSCCTHGLRDEVVEVCGSENERQRRRRRQLRADEDVRHRCSDVAWRSPADYAPPLQL